ncbi:MAG: hypothetical protein FJ091_03100 [Deltaproteobacteria bacterium]|nr:hypothetical protein [Deltaproteobacteria bacterium]
MLRAFGIVSLTYLLAAPASASTVTLFSDDFESPAYTLGTVSTNQHDPSTWQGGWNGVFASATISDDFAHTGTQSMRTNGSLSGAVKAIPNAGSGFELNNAQDWWVQAWVRVNSGSSGAQIALANGLGGCPLFRSADPACPTRTRALSTSRVSLRSDRRRSTSGCSSSCSTPLRWARAW